MPAAPVRFSPELDPAKPEEQDVVRQLEEQFDSIQETTLKDFGNPIRAVHAKAHGIARGTLTVKDGLAPELAQGLFAQGGRYEAIARISTNPGDILDDAISVPRGFALKVIGVQGDRLPGSEDDVTQDFVMANGPAFAAPTADKFLANLKMLARTTDKGESLKTALSAVLRPIAAGLKAVGAPSPALTQLGGAPQVHPLGETYYSQTAFRYGDYMAKFALFPVAKELLGLTGTSVNTSGRPDALREVVNAGLIEHGGEWELRVQLCRDLEKQPIDDPTIEWTVEDSPYQTVATLTVEPQIGWAPMESTRTEQVIAYNVWHGLAAFQPLGNINRARNETYKHAADFRGHHTGCPIHEPTSLADVP